MHAPKNGFFYVIDRENGKLISAEKIARSPGRPHRPGDRPAGRGRRRALRARRATVAPARSARTTGTRCRSIRKRGLAYYPAMHLTATFNDKGFDPKTWRATPWSISYGVGGQFISGASRPGTSLSSLQAWDPVRQRVAWEVPMDGVFHAGTMTTAGNLVFQGRVDGSLRAYSADTGKEVWRRDLGLGISAPPITYSVNGSSTWRFSWDGAARMAGVGGPCRRRTAGRTACTSATSWRSRSTARPPFRSSRHPRSLTPLKADFTVNPARAQAGAELFAKCVGLPRPRRGGRGHGAGSPGFVGRDLGRTVRAARSGGTRAARGMPAYTDIPIRN